MGHSSTTTTSTTAAAAHVAAASSRRLARAARTSGIVIGSGYFAWHLYNWKVTPSEEPASLKASTSVLSDEPEFLWLPPALNDRLKMAPLSPVDPKEELRSLIPRPLRRPWRLLREANRGNHEQHLLAVRELARASSLSDGECQQVAQSSEMRTAVGLARIKNVDLRLFLRPPPLPADISNSPTPALFRQVLASLPKSAAIHDCIHATTASALGSLVPGADDEALRDFDLEREFHRDSHHWILASQRRQISEERLVLICLHALLSHSTVKEHCKVMIENNCLPLLSKLLVEYPNNARVKSVVGKILANMSLFEESHLPIFQAGWVGVLASWKQDPNLLVNLPATKALCNLDVQFSDTYPPGIYLLLPEGRHALHKKDLSNWGVDVVFIHGILGGVFYSWRQADPDNSRGWGSLDLVSTEDFSYCWPKDWLADMSDHLRVVGVDFDSFLSQWGNNCPRENFKSSLTERSQDILKRLRDCGVGRRPVVFVGHSMGGLIIKKMLDQAQHSHDESDHELVRNTKGVVFYSTPHFGTRVAKLNAATKFIFFPTIEVQDLEADSPALSDLNHTFVELAKERNIPVLSFGELHATPYMGIDLTFVPPESSNPQIGSFYPVKANHMNICKPDSRRSILFRKMFRLVWDALEEATPFELATPLPNSARTKSP